jgi:DNA invertase Pin-like site-specific DNA recombinase
MTEATMSDETSGHKIGPHHLARKAMVYVRQSSEKQVRQNTESQRLQYALRDRARHLGWKQVDVIDVDLGCSASLGAARREGFDRLVGAIARGEVGIVLSREVSRLSRTEKDWCHLMEVCQVFDTLIGDGDRVYDLSTVDDQLVLGIKGTMSVAELQVLRMRLTQGMREKARRGEFARLLPPGYVRDATGKVVKDPDRRVQQAVDLVFRRFRETWSVRQTFTWFHAEKIELPVNKSMGGGLRIVWQVPTHAFVGEVLRNPFYAGAYVFGRRPVATVLEDGRLVRRQRGHALAAEECSVFLRDHHEGYIAWQTYEENLRMMRRNAQWGNGDESIAAVRAGQGLLAGMLRCGRCGRRLHVRYWGKSGTSARYLCKGAFDAGGEKHCLGFGGRAVDERFAQELLRVLAPLGARASLAAANQVGSSDDARRQALAAQLEQLRYETKRAFEQYDEVDPRNRLVAAELEARWNKKLEEADRVAADLAALGTPTSLQDHEQEAILALAERFEDVWRSDRCPVELKKKIIRTVVEEIVVSLDDATRTLCLVVHWKGGTHTQLEMTKPTSAAGQKTGIDDLDIIRKMAARYGDDEIAYVLNKLGRRTGKGKPWNQDRVATARRNHAIAGQSRSTPDPELLSQGRAAAYLGVSSATIRRLVSDGVLKKEQIVPWAPWEIRRADLDADAVKTIVARLRRTGHLAPEGVRATDQSTLFE